MTDHKALIEPESPVQPGRPRVPLLLGQRLYIERAYTGLKMSQANISQAIGVAIPRIRRHLIDQGLYEPRTAERVEARATMLNDAVQAYVDGERVVDICQGCAVNPAELYRLLRRRNIPFRTSKRVWQFRPGNSNSTTPVGEEVQHDHTNAIEDA